MASATISLGDRMKQYEKMHTHVYAQNLPMLVRLDGKNFSHYTKNLTRDNNPFCKGFGLIIKDTAEHLMKTFGARVSFCVSDEITLLFINDTAESQHPFGGKSYKIESLMAATASTYFVSKLPQYLPEKVGTLPIFDCRVFSTPTIMEAYNCIFWRCEDGYKNAISTVARLYFSAADIHKKNRHEQLQMLHEKGINFELYDSMYKRGTGLVKVTTKHVFTKEEIELLPPKHNARTNPEVEYFRHSFMEMNMDELRAFFNL